VLRRSKKAGQAVTTVADLLGSKGLSRFGSIWRRTLKSVCLKRSWSCFDVQRRRVKLVLADLLKTMLP
jgi:hypothetical protein